MGWIEEQEELAADLVSDPVGFGEPVTLPSGETTGIFYPYPPEPSNAFGSEVGLDMMLQRQRAPELHLRDVDAVAVGLTRGDKLTVRGQQWVVASLPAPDGAGITVIELKPTASAGGPPPDQEWQ